MPDARPAPPALIAIFGPTGVGKTEVAIELAAALRERGERPVAVSADAFQLYEGLDALTAKPSAAELERLEHRLISSVSVSEEFSVARFVELAHSEIDALLAERRRPILVGGTGLYLRAALTELELKPPPGPGLRDEVERELAEIGVEALHGRLSDESARAVHPRDRKRIVRALELERMGETPYATSEQLWSERLRVPADLFGLVTERELLDERLARRVDTMLAAGAREEVEQALERGASRTARKAIGFRELEACLAGEVELEQAAGRITRRQRQYARRQLTWMRKLAGVELIDRTGLDAAATAAAILARRGT